MSEACNAVKNAKKKCFNGQGFHCVDFRSKKDLRQHFGFDQQSLSDHFLFRKKKDKVSFSLKEDIPNDALEGTSVLREGSQWYLVVPRRVSIKVPDNQRNGVVAIDPGIRTFITYFAENCFGKVGNGDFKRIYRLCLSLDRLTSKVSKARCRQKRRMKKACERIRHRIKNLVDDLHKKTAYFLVTRFDTILLPTFETQQMLSKLRSKTARSMLSWAHYRFKSFLKAKAEEYSAKVVDVDEAYTSKTCSYCGRIRNIGSRTVFRCECGIVVDRDYNGGRGIYLRSLAATPSLSELTGQSVSVNGC
jgi:putative transposase